MRVYVNGGTCPEPPEPPGTARNQPEPPGTPRNPPEPTRNLEKSANDKIKKKQITKHNTNQIKIMKIHARISVTESRELAYNVAL